MKQECFFWQSGFKNPPLIEILDKFAKEQAVLIKNTSIENDSKCVESLNAIYGRWAPNKQCWNHIDMVGG